MICWCKRTCRGHAQWMMPRRLRRCCNVRRSKVAVADVVKVRGWRKWRVLSWGGVGEV